MQTISKTGLKIIEVELMDFEMNPEFTVEDLVDQDCQLIYSFSTQRVNGIENNLEGDEIKIETETTYSTPNGKEIFRIQVGTIYQTKYLKVKNVTEMFWVYITETAFRHCMALARYKTAGILPESVNFFTLSMINRTDTQQKINEIWG